MEIVECKSFSSIFSKVFISSIALVTKIINDYILIIGQTTKCTGKVAETTGGFCSPKINFTGNYIK